MGFITEATFHAEKGHLLRKLVEAIHDLCTDVNFKFDAYGISMKSMNHTNVCLVHFHLVSDGFKSYSCESGNHEVGINLPNLLRVLKCIDKDDEITLASDAQDSITISARSDDGKRVSTYTLKLMNIDAEDLDLTDMHHSASITFSSAQFAKTMRDMASLGDDLVIEASAYCVTLSTSGDLGTASILMEASEDQSFRVDHDTSVRLGLRYLNSFAKASSLCQEATVLLTPEMPVLVSFDIPDMGYIKFYLAPKMGDGDEVPC
jgi:proliferating cell nuclear antigen